MSAGALYPRHVTLNAPAKERLRRAFSLRRNLRAMLVAPEGHLRPVDGLRALSILWVMLFHSAWYTFGAVPLVLYARQLGQRWMLPFWRGDFGVDVFFVLSGFLIAGLLADEHARAGRIRLGRFYARRWIRLWPALAVGALVEVSVFRDNPRMIWANLLYVSNLLPFQHMSMKWTWSLSLEEQFYLLCPWLVAALAPRGSRMRYAVLAAIGVALCAIVGAIVVRGGFHGADSEIVVNRDPQRWIRAYDDLYVKPWTRAAPLLAGVAAAYVFRSPRAMDALARRRVMATAGLVVALALAAVCTHWQFVEHAARPVEVLYLATYRALFGVAVAYVMTFALSANPVGRALGWGLSSRVLYPIAQVSYSAYLLNPMVTTTVHHHLARMAVRTTTPAALFFLPFDFAATLGAAAVVHLLVERPFLELRPRPG
jgi:peptidoglycan/LPS O-acetylase OafA/YrhL